MDYSLRPDRTPLELAVRGVCVCWFGCKRCMQKGVQEYFSEGKYLIRREIVARGGAQAEPVSPELPYQTQSAVGPFR